MLKKYKRFCITSLLSIATLFITYSICEADIIDGSPTIVEGWGTFRDSDTGKTWLDFDSVNHLSVGEMITTTQAAGWTYAKHDEVVELLDANPRGADDDSLFETMGSVSLIGKEIIWGALDNGGSQLLHGYALSWIDDVKWGIFPISTVNNHDNFFGQGIWAYKSSVPEPSLGLLLGISLIGLVGVGAVRRIRQKALVKVKS